MELELDICIGKEKDEPPPPLLTIYQNKLKNVIH